MQVRCRTPACGVRCGCALHRCLQLSVLNLNLRLLERRPTGRTILRNKLLRARGWLVVDVPYFEWNALRTSAARTDYLKAAIALEVQTKYKFMRQREISRSRGLSRPAAAAASA